MDNYNYHKGMNVIIQELKDLLKTKSIGTDSDQTLLLDFQVALGTIYLMTANLPRIISTGWFLSWTTDIKFFYKTGIIWGRKYLFQFFIYILYNDNVLTLGTYLNILYLNGGVLYGNN